MTWVVAVVVAIVALGALYELYCAFQRIGVRPSIWTGTLALGALFVAAAAGAPVLAVMGIVNVYILISLAQHLTRRNRKGALTDWAFSLSALLYVGFTMVHFVLIMRIEGPVEASWFAGVDRFVGAGGTALGLAWLGVALAATLATELVVSIPGRFRRQFSSGIRVSSLVGLLAGTTIGGLAGYLLGVPVPIAFMFVCGGLIAAGAILGGRCESLVKAQLGTNPAVRSIPGRGGLLDRSAAFRVTVPLTFYLASFSQWQN